MAAIIHTTGVVRLPTAANDNKPMLPPVRIVRLRKAA
jgi:hypothetical protein